jgi:hypothetical protein
VEASVYTGDGYLARTTVYRIHPTWRVVWEQAL